VKRIEALRREKLRELLRYCYDRIPYYREQFRRIGAEPEDFRSPEDLVKFPILDKETLRDHAEELLDPNADRSGWIKYRSSGSTGIPLELWYTPQERLRMGFTVTRELIYNGLKPWYRLVNITEPRHSAPKNRWYHRLGVMNESPDRLPFGLAVDRQRTECGSNDRLAAEAALYAGGSSNARISGGVDPAMGRRTH